MAEAVKSASAKTKKKEKSREARAEGMQTVEVTVKKDFGSFKKGDKTVMHPSTAQAIADSGFVDIKK